MIFNNNIYGQTNGTYSIYNNGTYGISVKYPSSLQIVNASFSEPRHSLVNVVVFEGSSGFLFDGRLWISFDDLQGNYISLKQYTDGRINCLTNGDAYKVTNYDLNLKLSGLPAYKIESEGDILKFNPFGDGASDIHKRLEIETVIGDKAYAITYDIDDYYFQKNMPIVNEIISSFEIDEDVISDTLNKSKVSIDNYHNPQIIKVDHFECLGIKTPTETA